MADQNKQKEKPNNVAVDFICTITYEGSEEWEITEEEWDAMDSDDKETQKLSMRTDIVERILSHGDSDFDIVISHTGEDISYL